MEVKHQQHDTQKLIICHHHKGGKSQEDVYSFKLVIFLIIDLLPDGEITTIEFVNALVYVGATLFQMYVNIQMTQLKYFCNIFFSFLN